MTFLYAETKTFYMLKRSMLKRRFFSKYNDDKGNNDNKGVD